MSGIGLEVGGTWIRGVLLDGAGVIEERVKVPTPTEPEELAPALETVWRRLGSSSPTPPALPVVLAAAPTCRKDGRVEAWASRPQHVGHPLLTPALASSLTTAPLDDVSAAALAEHLAATGSTAVAGSTLLVAAGTGVGAGWVVDDQTWYGARGNALDLGHIPVPSAVGESCPCGRTGCVQAVASGRLLERWATEQGRSAAEVLAAAGDDEADALRIIERLAVPFAEATALAARLLDPHRIVLGGGLLGNAPIFERVRRILRADGVSASVERGRLGTWSGAVGAAIEAQRSRGGRLPALRVDDDEPRHRIALVEGPNLDLLGEREPHHYGVETADHLLRRLRRLGDELGCHLWAVQSNHEGVLVDWVRNRRRRLDGVVINPAALTAHGYALRDVLVGSSLPFIEVHLSNLDAREAWHRESCFAADAVGRISGLGGDGYQAALRGLVQQLERQGQSEG